MDAAADQAVTSLTVSFDWQPAGRVTLDAAGGLVFPLLPAAPGLYRFSVESSDPRPGVYVGEASILRRRMQHYRTPGPSQSTNIRLNAMLRDALRGGATVTVSVVTAASLALDEGPVARSISARRTGRLIVEQAAITAASAATSPVPGSHRFYPRILDRPGVGETEYE